MILHYDYGQACAEAQRRADDRGQPHGVFNATDDGWLVLRITGEEHTSGFDQRLCERFEPWPFSASRPAPADSGITRAAEQPARRRRWRWGRGR